MSGKGIFFKLSSSSSSRSRSRIRSRSSSSSSSSIKTFIWNPLITKRFFSLQAKMKRLKVYIYYLHKKNYNKKHYH